jgi:hypothetical protein
MTLLIRSSVPLSLYVCVSVDVGLSV